MTSDAKIGLLLGLVFIFIIAFIINGLPSFRSDKKNNELTATRLDWQNKAPGIGEIPREVIKETNYGHRPAQQFSEPVQPTLMNDKIRFEMPLPGSSAAVKGAGEDMPGVPASPQFGPEVETSRPSLPRVYVVAAGDNLSTIAKRFYGIDEGNKLNNINKIFQANRRALKSPDEIYEGQKIVIPALTDSQENNRSTGSIFSSRMFEKVKSIGQRYTANDSSGINRGGKYVVREGDNLWRIAAEQLGDGSRYREIAKLNAGTLDDEDRLIVGMQLRLPSR